VSLGSSAENQRGQLRNLRSFERRRLVRGNGNYSGRRNSNEPSRSLRQNATISTATRLPPAKISDVTALIRQAAVFFRSLRGRKPLSTAAAYFSSKRGRYNSRAGFIACQSPLIEEKLLGTISLKQRSNVAHSVRSKIRGASLPKACSESRRRGKFVRILEGRPGYLNRGRCSCRA